MLFQREIKHLLGVLIILLAVVAITAAYWAVSGSITLLQRQDNPRLLEAEASVRRGAIVDRTGNELADSVPISSNVGAPVQRVYHYPATYGAIGYYSLRYGASGAEAAYDNILRGRDQARSVGQAVEDEMLHRPPMGDDIMLSIDLDIQQRLADRLNGMTGAGVVIDIPSGDVLALVSLPTYDPNTLDADWDMLVQMPGDPFFNRVVQGRYQPGSALQTPLMAAASLVGYPLDTRFPDATQPMTLNNLDLRCAVRLPEVELTLSEAYAFACPRPFATLAHDLERATVDAAYDTFHLRDFPSLPGFESIPVALNLTPTPTPPVASADTALTEAALGQADVVVSPLMMALIAAGIVNDGNAPQPRMLIATRSEDEAGVGDWQELTALNTSFPIATANTARRLQDFMRDAVANGAAQNAGRPAMDVGGHASLAYAGDETHVWFIGFTTLGGGRGVATAIVVENNDDPGLAADIGGDVLSVAHQVLNSTP